MRPASVLRCSEDVQHMQRLTIGEVARRAGVNRETIRYYERRRLMPRPARSGAGYRIFLDDAVERLRFIKHAQALGFTLKEVRELLGLRINERTSCDKVRAQAARKLADVNVKIAALIRIRATLDGLVAACDSRRSSGRCPILESLESPEPIAAKVSTR